MKLYLISQIKNCNYDTFDAAIVVANNVEEARHIYPDDCSPDQWVDNLIDVIIEEIGEADIKYTQPCTILSSFNAG